MQVIDINAKGLNAVRLFAAKQDIRYYLNAVLIQAVAGKTRIVATDGCALAAHDSDGENQLDGESYEVLIPTSAFDQLKPDNQFPVTLHASADRLELSQYDKTIVFKAVDGKFPDYRRVIPEQVSGEFAHLNPEFIARFAKAQAIFDKKMCPLFYHNGTGSTLVALQNASGFVGVLMPLAHKGKPIENPAPSTASFRSPLVAAEAVDCDLA